jgi:hypothetical protein
MERATKRNDQGTIFTCETRAGKGCGLGFELWDLLGLSSLFKGLWANMAMFNDLERPRTIVNESKSR